MKTRSSSVGQKTHPIGFRLGIVKEWQARWFADKQQDYRGLVYEDLQIRDRIKLNYPDAGISRVEIERSDSDVTVTVHTSRPGIVIGRGGQRVDELRKDLESLMRRRTRINVQEIRQPELDAFLVARNVADQLERRIAFRRAIRQTLGRTMQAGAQGIKIICAGRLGGADIARSEKAMEGRVPLHTLRADIDYGLAEAATEFGRIGVKVWIYKGDILPEAAPEPEIEEEISPIEVTLTANPDPLPEPVATPAPLATPTPVAPPASVAPVAPVAPPAQVAPAAPAAPPATVSRAPAAAEVAPPAVAPPAEQPAAEDAPAAVEPPPEQPVAEDAPAAVEPPPEQPVAEDAPAAVEPPPEQPVAEDAPAAVEPPKEVEQEPAQEAESDASTEQS